MIKLFGEYVKIDTPNTSLIIKKHEDRALMLYYGKKLNDHDDYGYFSKGKTDRRGASNDDWANIPSVMSSNGEVAQKTNYTNFHDENGLFTNRFNLVDAEIVEGFSSPLPTARKKAQICRLTYIDEVSKATLYQYYTVFDDCDVITVHSELVNTTGKTIFVNKLASCQLDFVGDKAQVVTFDGTWVDERNRHETDIVAGRFEIDSKLGLSSPVHNPFIMVKIRDNVIGLNLIWSGNHKEEVEISPYKRVRIITGLNDFAFNYKLNAGESLVSPEAVMVIANDEKTITSNLHKFSLNHIVNPDFAYKDRPVLINNWEGTYFNFTGEKILQMATVAKKVGIEMFVLDDGWFGKRDDDRSGLGDWYDNEKKTGGLKKLADNIKALGLKFGLWVEPEMISRDSDLFRAHPEYAMAIPGVEPVERRWQLAIDMCNDEVCNYLADTLIKIFKEVGVDYVKWDHNRAFSDVYSSKLENQGEYHYKYYVNQYKLLDKITKACPDVLFESCASGGCRYDLGMQYFMPQNWGSDNTNAYDRLFIQEGTLVAYPQSTMGAHVAASHSNPKICLESRFNVASVGAFGYEYDITKSPKEELSTIKKQVAYYKKHRRLFQYGNYYKLGDGLEKTNYGGWILVSDKKDEAIAVVVNKNLGFVATREHFAFAGLDDNTLYSVIMRPQDNLRETYDFTAYGDALNSFGLDFGSLDWAEADEIENSGAFRSRMFYIKKIGKANNK
ncbi:MAG: alpha-galactosidase [Clostridia bacterium]|nr:alpha-galactosidase [Clostridia bacterium]